MNAPETITEAINQAHDTLAHYDEAMSADQIAYELAGRIKPTKAHTKEAVKQLKQLADLGMIEMEPRAGGVPFYRLIAAPPSVVTHNPHTGTPRNPLDIESDPAGLLIVKDGEPLKAHQAEDRILTPEAEAEREDFEARYGMLGNCSCHISPPCGSCTHPGNPRNQEEDETAWMAAGDSEGGETDAPAAINDTPKFGHGLSCGACHDGCAGEQCKVERDSPPIDAQREEFTLLGLIADIRAAAGDPNGRLMQDELVQHIAAVVKERDDLRERMEGIAEQLRAGTIPELENVTGAEDLAPHVKTLCDSLGAAEIVATGRGHTIDGLRREVEDLRDRLDAQIKQWQTDTGLLAADLRAAMEARSQAINEAARLRAELAIERQARKALQEQGNATDVTAAAVGYLVRVPKRPPMIRRKPEAARLAALSAVRAGAARAEVLAVVPVGAARRGAEWGDA